MRRRLLIAGLFLLLAIPVVLVLAGRASRPLAVAVWYVAWLGNLALKALPQVVFWILLMLVAVVLAVASLLHLSPGRPAAPQARPPSERQGPVREWTRAIQRTAAGDYFKWQLAQQLSWLLLEATDCHDLPPSDRSRPGPLIDSLEAPPEIRAYVQAGMGGWFWDPARTRSRLRWKPFGVARQQTTPQGLDLDLERVIEFMEDTLEVHDDRRRD